MPMDDWQPAVTFEDFDYANEYVNLQMINGDLILAISKGNEYYAGISITYYQGTFNNHGINAGTYYKKLSNISIDDVTAFGTLEEDTTPDFLVFTVQSQYPVTNQRANFNLQLDKLDPEKFPLFFV